MKRILSEKLEWIHRYIHPDYKVLALGKECVIIDYDDSKEKTCLLAAYALFENKFICDCQKVFELIDSEFNLSDNQGYKVPDNIDKYNIAEKAIAIIEAHNDLKSLSISYEITFNDDSYRLDNKTPSRKKGHTT